MKPAVKTLFALCLAHALLECYAGVWPIYKVLAGLDLKTAARMATFAGVSASMLQPFFGIWSERGIARGMVLTGVALTMLLALAGPVGNLLAPVFAEGTGNAATGAAAPLKSATTYWLLGIVLVVSRLGHSMFHPPSATLAHQALADRPTYGLGLFVALGWLGVGVSQTSFSAAYLSTGGHSEILLIPGLLILLWIAAWLAPSQRVVRAHQPFRSKIADLMQVKRTVLSLFSINLMLGLSASALFFLFPELLRDKGCADHLVNGNALILWMLGTAAGVAIGGYAGSHQRGNRLLVLCLLINFLAYEAFLRFMHPSAWVMAGGCIAAGFLTGLCQPLPLARGQTVAPRHAQLIGGVLMGWTWALSNFAPMITAWLIEDLKMTIPEALGWMGLTNLAAVVCAFVLPAAPVEAELDAEPAPVVSPTPQA